MPDLSAVAMPPNPSAVPGECTSLLVGAHGSLARRLMADFPRFGVRAVLVTEVGDATRYVRAWQFDAIVVDAREPDAARPMLLHALSSQPATPVLMLSSPRSENETILDIERGATDVISSATSSQLIATKIKRLAHMAGPSRQARAPEAAPPSTLHVGSLLLDLRDEVARVDGVRVELTSRGFAVLALLARFAGHVVDRTTLSLHLGAASRLLRSRAFDLQISHIRAALARAGARDVAIDTVYRRGYRLGRRSDAQ